MSDNTKLGQRIRQKRKAKGMSLNDVAEKIQKTSSYLSQVERGLAEPSITALREIARALEVPIFYFLIEEENHNAVVRKDERRILNFPGSHLTFELLSPDLNREMEVIAATLEPGAATSEDPLNHLGEECTIVIQGRMYIKIGDQEYELDPGDSIYYKASLPHKIESIGEDDLHFISAITPPNF
ncbi:XRE family transcriptional regulator [Halanaerobium saccharolyticum]|uniref:XRE family transcriptional regulator n=1 Tax=Halanaerobium saccharolyticum TaxID=43595 RepID=A0A4R7Z529_9FIRM|nr:helix-turn-helix domain-containing protein [Halanaerobium saccharolyticum]RAK12765.1 XRE family transcriptional regulator [Halanaerobium saccharolyticum]TDW02978.1 XRE family transcriptional regulator [Halanaerobium saccharolyticum]TDX62838.1 XRE family transcriptional regulator [Halanaerobium saccharolyticum]